MCLGSDLVGDSDFSGDTVVYDYCTCARDSAVLVAKVG